MFGSRCREYIHGTIMNNPKEVIWMSGDYNEQHHLLRKYILGRPDMRGYWGRSHERVSETPKYLRLNPSYPTTRRLGGPAETLIVHGVVASRRVRRVFAKVFSGAPKNCNSENLAA